MIYFAYIGIAVTVLAALVLLRVLQAVIIPWCWHSVGFLYAYVRGRRMVGAKFQPIQSIRAALREGFVAARKGLAEEEFSKRHPWGQWHGGFSVEWHDEEMLAVMRERIRLLHEEDYTVREAIKAVPEPHKKS